MEVVDGESFDGSDVGGVCGVHIQQSNDNSSSSLITFGASPADDFDSLSAKRLKTSRDPMSHRIIEKRRRDRMNNCLADLSRLIPTSYLKQGQGRIEKTEIIEMAIKHIKTLQAQVEEHQAQLYGKTKPDYHGGSDGSCCRGKVLQGFKECQEETLRYFEEGEAMSASDPFCQRVMEHLSCVCQRTSGGDQKPEMQQLLDVDNQHMGSSSQSALGCSSPAIPINQDSSILPLMPAAGAMIVPTTPIADKHLRNLLASRALQRLESERKPGGPARSSHSDMAIATCAPIDTSVTVTPATCTSAVAKRCESMTEGVSSGYMSDMSLCTSTVDWMRDGREVSRETSMHNVYKFKHNITKRFSLEGKAPAHSHTPYDGSSSASSKEADEELCHHTSTMRHKKNKHRHMSSSDSTPYPTSDMSAATGTSSPDSGEGGEKERSKKVSSAETRSPGDSCSRRSSLPLPGFVLHPSGTHYMPMSVSYKSVPDMFDMGVDHGPSVFHPISIPVHFRGPVISVPSSAMRPQHLSSDAAHMGRASIATSLS